jgi:hypothetical protein
MAGTKTRARDCQERARARPAAQQADAPNAGTGSLQGKLVEQEINAGESTCPAVAKSPSGKQLPVEKRTGRDGKQPKAPTSQTPPSGEGNAATSGRPPMSRLVGAPHHSGPQRRSRGNPVGDREHCGFVSLERNLLCQHHIASHQGALGNETPPDLRLHFVIKLQNITHGAIMNSITPAGVRARDFEITLGIKLCPLIR